jgi:hypothetical protein
VPSAPIDATHMVFDDDITKKAFQKLMRLT